MLGAWGGHVVAAADAPAGISASALRRRQIPLAIVMVGADDADAVVARSGDRGGAAVLTGAVS